MKLDVVDWLHLACLPLVGCGNHEKIFAIMSLAVVPRDEMVAMPCLGANPYLVLGKPSIIIQV